MGGASARLSWNRVLMQEGVATAYANILDRVRQEFGHDDPRAYYALLPTLDRQTSDLAKLLGKSVYQALADRPSIRVLDGDSHNWVQSRQALQIPPLWRDSMYDSLCEEGLRIVDPPLPGHVAAGYKSADAAVFELTPERLRLHLRKDRDVACKLEEAPNVCLRKREWLESILRFCLSDGKKNIAGLPLALCSDGLLHTFGKTTLFRGTADQRAILAPCPHWFVDPSFDDNCNIPENPEEGFQSMQLYHVIANLGKAIRPVDGGQSARSFNPQGDKPPNDSWLTAFYSYLAGIPHATLRQHYPELMPFAVVPDRHNLVHPPNRSSTPLLPAKEVAGSQELLAALEKLRLPMVCNREPVEAAVREASGKHSAFFTKELSGQTLIECLHAYAPQWQSTEYLQSVHDPVLSFLSEERFVSSYTESDVTRLKSLKLFPTESNALTSLTDVTAFIPSGFSPPTFSPVRLLLPGPGRKWTILFKKLGIPELNQVTFIENEVLPKYASLKATDQLLACDWLRRHVSAILANLHERKPGVAVALRNKIACAPLVRCTDGRLHPACETYDPRARAVKEILGSHAVVRSLVAVIASFCVTSAARGEFLP